MDLNPEDIIAKFLFPIFRVASESELVERMTIGTLIYAFSVLILPNPAPYGRYTANESIFSLSPKLAWFIQESPSFLVPLILVIFGKKSSYGSFSNQLCLGMFMIHYLQR